MRASLLLAACLLATSTAVAQPHAGPVELIDAGAAPTRALRHRFTADLSQQLRLRVQTEVRFQMGARDATMPVPIMRLDLTLGPTQIADGNLRYAFRVDAVGIEGDVSPEVTERLQPQIEGLVGLHGTAAVDDRGAMTDFDYELPAGASDQLRQQAQVLRQSLGQLMPRFPEEPVGVGAEWRIQDELHLPQTNVAVATTFRLLRWDGDDIELAVRTQTLDAPAQPEGTSVDVSGSGRIHFQVGTLSVRGRVQTVAVLEAAGPSGQMRMRIRTRSQITPR